MNARGTKSPSSGNGNGTPRPSSPRPSLLSTSSILILVISHSVAFLVGSMFASNHTSTVQRSMLQPHCPECPSMKTFMNASVARNMKVAEPAIKCESCPPCPKQRECPKCVQATKIIQKESTNPGLPSSVNRIAAGMATATKEDFAKTFDLGVPIDAADSDRDRDVLMVYSRGDAMPTKLTDSKSVELVTADELTENCDIMHVAFRNRGGSKNMCLALVPNYESHHLQTWMRLPERGRGDREHPLRLVPRTMQWDGKDEFGVPKFERHTKKTWKELKVYLETYEGIVAELKEIVKRIKYKNTIVVLVCNHGQSELLMNFVCAARTRGLDTQHVLVFATDEETKELAESMGMTAYYDENNFGHMPTEAAKQYGDMKFVKLMMAKVLCVHLTILTGVDVLFQDVDVIWFKDPLPYFHNRNSTIYNNDAYFQDDGARSLRYAPYSANSGFYYLRNNQRTVNFLTQLVLAGDLIAKSFSHQQAMIAVMSEQMSLHGFKAKVLLREDEGFPGGFQFHSGRKKDYMRQLFAGQKDPYIFHMSWTLNKDNKLLFFKQMGEWYVKEECVSKKLDDIALAGGTAVDACCSAEALFSCHYQDKPSKYPCSDSPPIDKNGKDWWAHK
ncbi:Nucleotide-diphospho-sugar transferase [Seminavis robusta]|uniref:Nucleotide-diphospho-sugar transferase n=1 Tax=Seminavis robusta TaxID=568900 RepID=A0A9N8EC89_9STRA|nr:Nucleotide-diphospho-sugar transferase [Seminavis robusta]|eukprot:Sro791_g202980.1 Nucleotide-diphospho-sugar transferase (616) ;mRNA; r:26269-28840